MWRAITASSFIVLVAVGLLCTVFWVTEATGQGADPQEVPGLFVKDSLDLCILETFLDKPATRVFVASRLAQGKTCRHLGIEMSGESGMHRDYSLAVAMQGASGTSDVLHADYQYRSPAAPAIPPDSITFWSDVLTLGAAPVVFADSVTYDFLLHVLGNPPAAIVDPLFTHDLLQITVRRLGSPETVRVTLEYEGSGGNITLVAWAEHYGESCFGPISVDQI